MKLDTSESQQFEIHNNQIAIIIIPVESEEYKKILKVLNAVPPLTILRS